MKRERLRGIEEMLDNPRDLPKGREVIISKLEGRKGVRIVNPLVAKDNRKNGKNRKKV